MSRKRIALVQRAAGKIVGCPQPGAAGAYFFQSIVLELTEPIELGPDNPPLSQCQEIGAHES